MRYLIPFFVFLSISTTSFVCAQEYDSLFVRYSDRFADSDGYKTDTLFRSNSFEPMFLFESDWIPNTRNQLNALSYGLYPKEIDAECIEEGIEGGENQLLSIERTDSTLLVNYRVVANCCFHFLCDLSIEDSSTLNLSYIEYGVLCGCTCYHDISFELDVNFWSEEDRAMFQKIEWVTLNDKLRTKLE